MDVFPLVHGKKRKEFEEKGVSLPELVSTTRKKGKNANSRNASKFPNPNYIEFKTPDFIDDQGREYKLEEGCNDSMDSIVKQKKIWIRLPIGIERDRKKRGKDPLIFPDPMGETLNLYHVLTQSMFVCKTDGVFYGQRRKTGFANVEGLEFVKRYSKPPSEYEDLLLLSNQ